MTDKPRFPEGFADLEPFAAWALDSEEARGRRRRESELAELEAFYNALLPRLSDVLSYLQEHRLPELSEPQRDLLNLCFALAEIAPFVEQYRRTILPELFDEERFVALHDAGDAA